VGKFEARNAARGQTRQKHEIAIGVVGDRASRCYVRKFALQLKRLVEVQLRALILFLIKDLLSQG
jgi:hypothetical protein